MSRYLRAFTLLIIFALISIPVAAQEPGPSPAGDSQNRDAEEYANTVGVDLDEATYRLALQDEIGDLNEQLSTHEGELFAGLWVEHTPAFKVIAAFIRDGENIIQPYIENGPLESLVEIHPATVSLASLVTEQEVALALISDIDVQVDSGIDMSLERVELKVSERERFDAELQKRDIQLPAHVEVITVERLAEPVADIYAGLSFDNVICTTGFSVQHYERELGISTAGHCGNTPPTPELDFKYSASVLPHQATAFGGSTDVQWHTAPAFTVRNWYFNGSGNYLVNATKSRSYQYVNEWVCHYGRTTGYGCGYIMDLNASLSSFIPGSTATYIRVWNPIVDMAEPGDSGGPWFSGNTAYGIMVAHQTGTNNGYYMAVNYFDDLNINVYTGKETYLPDVHNKDGWLSTITVRNGGTSGRRVSVIYLDNAGNYIAGSKDDCLLAPNATCSHTPPSNFEGSAIVDGSEDLSVSIVTRQGNRAYAASGSNPGTVGDPAVEYAATTLYAPAPYHNAWNYNSTLFIQNTGSATASGTLYLVGRAGYPSGNCSFSINPGGRLSKTASSCVSSLPSPWLGSARIVSDNQPIAAQVLADNPTATNARSAVATATGQTVLYLPAAYKNKWNTSSGVVVQNLGSGNNNVKLFFYDRAGNLTYPNTYTFPTLASGQANGLWLPNLSTLPDGWVGSIRVESLDNQPLAAIAQVADADDVYEYTGSTGSFGSTVLLPRAARYDGSRTTGFIVLNPGSSSVTVQRTYYNTDGSVKWSGPNISLAAHASAGYHQSGEGSLGSGWTGSILLQADGPIVAVMREDDTSTFSAAAYNGLVR